MIYFSSFQHVLIVFKLFHSHMCMHGEDWKKVTIKVIHKKGDVENVQKIRLASENPTRQQTTLQHTD